MSHGGKRTGAGRKPAPETRKVPVSKKLAQDVAAYIRACDNGTYVIETAIRRSKGFREWAKQRGKR